MAVCPVIKEEVLFGFNLSEEVNMHLQQAAASVSSRQDSAAALRRALQSSPEQLEALVASYKLHFYNGELEQAEAFVFQTLIKAALQGGFNHDWQQLDADSALWDEPRGPARIFLYSLKALAFIRLRQRMFRSARLILDSIARIDPQDMVGAEVIREMLEGLSN
jgi:hypothetical protein